MRGAVASGAVAGIGASNQWREQPAPSRSSPFPTAAEQKQRDSATAAEKKRPEAIAAEKPRSDYRGVCWHKKTNKWRVQIIRVDGTNQYVGTFDDEEEAARAYDGAARSSDRPDRLSLLNLPTAAEQKRLDSAAAAEKKRSEAIAAEKPRSDHRGVCWVTKANKWKASIYVDGSNKHIGMFTDEEEAARAHDGAARSSGRPDRLSRLNFPTAAEKKRSEAIAAEKKRSEAADLAAVHSEAIADDDARQPRRVSRRDLAQLSAAAVLAAQEESTARVTFTDAEVLAAATAFAAADRNPARMRHIIERTILQPREGGDARASTGLLPADYQYLRQKVTRRADKISAIDSLALLKLPLVLISRRICQHVSREIAEKDREIAELRRQLADRTE